jgi:primase-polymerase (primpol)-like protein
MNRDIADIAKWAQSQGWAVEDDSKGYTRFYNPQGEYVTNYPATPSRPHRRIQDLKVNLRKAGLPWPPPSKKEQRSQRTRGDES